MEKLSEHPLAQSIFQHAQSHNISPREVDHFEALPGRGVKGNIDGTNYFIGNRKLIANQQLHLPQSVEDRVSQLEIQGKTVMILADEKSVLGAVSVADIAKETSKKAIEKLKKRGLNLVMITGDNYNTAQAIAQEVGISKTLAEVLPKISLNKCTTAKNRKKSCYGWRWNQRCSCSRPSRSWNRNGFGY